MLDGGGAGAGTDRRSLPDAQAHHDHSQGHPAEDAYGDDGFEADATLSFFRADLRFVLIHDGRSSGPAVGTRWVALVARWDLARAMPCCFLV